METWELRTVLLYAALGVGTFVMAMVGLRWWGFPPHVAFWLGWWSSLVWVSLWAWSGGTRWRRAAFARRLEGLRREFEAAQDLTRLEVYLRRSDGSLQVHHLVPTTREGVPLMSSPEVTKELAHAATLLAQGRNWSFRETRLTETLYAALRDSLVRHGFLYPIQARQPVQWTADEDGGGLALLEAAAEAEGLTASARHVRRMRLLSVAVCGHGAQNSAPQTVSRGGGGVNGNGHKPVTQEALGC